jgi:DNA end-binding protein Ku
MRPLWKGAISFGLVNIPVGLYSAIDRKSAVSLELLRDSDHSRIRYKKVAEADGLEVPREHIVKGFEYEKGNYVVLTGDDFQRVQIKSNQLVEIKEFVKLDDIEPCFFDEPYLLAPEKGGEKAYALLRMVLKKTGLVGVSKIVIRPPREHLAAVKALDDALVLETMHFADELRDPGELQVPRTQVSEKESDMALSLVKAMTARWDAKKFHDEYREALMQLIEQKIKTGAKKLPAPAGAKKATGKVIDLVSLLQKSIGESEKGTKRKPAKRAGRAPQRKAA